MRLFRDFSALPSDARHAVVALGNFDGFHVGHQAVIAETKRIATQAGAPAAVLTFAPHPREFFNPQAGPLAIYDERAKLTLLEQAGVEVVYLAAFNTAFSQLRAEDFIRNILVEKLRVRHVITGENFIFGHRRGGDAAMLAEKAKALGFSTTRLPGVVDAMHIPVSSTRIRECLRSGEMAEASHLLGRPYAISGPVQRGEGKGRTIGFPTANIAVSHIFRPKSGVYAVRTNFGPGVANLGVRPTMGEALAPLLEVHCFDFDGDLYGKTLEVQLVKHIRDEQKFSGLKALKSQIAQDCAKAAEILQFRA